MRNRAYLKSPLGKKLKRKKKKLQTTKIKYKGDSLLKLKGKSFFFNGIPPILLYYPPIEEIDKRMRKSKEIIEEEKEKTHLRKPLVESRHD